MAYFIRDDRMTQREADRRNHGKPERYHIVNTSPGLTSFRGEDGRYVFIHSAPTVMHDACANSNVPGMSEVAGDPSVEATTKRFAARDAFAEGFGPGQSLCWAPLWTNNPDRAPDCYFCGEPVVGKG